MGLVAKENSGGGDFTLAPQGTHAARCVRVIDLGTQPGSQTYPTPRHKVLLGWELPEETHEWQGEKMPIIVQSRYTLSLHENASLRHDLESWRGRKFTTEELAGFDLAKVAGVPCMVTITHSDDGKYANVKAVTACPKSLEVPPAVNGVVYYRIEDGANAAFSTFSDGLQATIRRAPEWEGPADPDTRGDGDPGFGDDSIPF